MELHLFIIWEKGRHLEKEITDDILKHFSIIQTIDILWSQEKVKNNFSRFYGVNLPIGVNKQEQCGGGEFRMLIVEDPKPQYDWRETSHGKEYVNINMFDAKTKYREWVGGIGTIHATNTITEFNHDITLILGVNQSDYLNSLSKRMIYEKLHLDIVGTWGWDSISQLFYVLNNTVDYVVMRGDNELCTNTFNENHRDCDLLVANTTNAQYIINGKTLPESIRPHEEVIINDNHYYLDLWSAELYYFDIRWCYEMLKTRINNNGIFILNKENYFYCLLYHCLIIKNNIAPDYKSFIDSYKTDILHTSQDNNILLVNYLCDKGYEIVSYRGNGAGFHIEDPILSQYHNKYGCAISKNCCIQKDLISGQKIEWKSCVYDNGNYIFKAGSDWLIKNEYHYLQKLSSTHIAPKCINCEERLHETILTMEKIYGKTITEFFSEKCNCRKTIIKKTVRQIVDILKRLKDNQIIHRDFTGNNILINNIGKVYVIDFGWAIDITSTQYPHPELLATPYCPPDMYSDFYTIGAVFDELFHHHLPYLNRLGAKLRDIQWQDYINDTSYLSKLKSIEYAVDTPFGPRDYFQCFLFRHHHVSRYYYRLKKKVIKKAQFSSKTIYHEQLPTF